MIYQALFSGLALGALYGLVALGFVLIYRATRVVNFAQGEIMMLTGYIGFQLVSNMGLPYFIGIPLALLITGALGYLMDRAFFRPLIGYSTIQLVIATVAVSSIIVSLTGMIWGHNPTKAPSPFPEAPYMVGNVALSAGHVWVIITAAIFVLVFYLFYNYSKLGVSLRATAEDQIGAWVCGVNVKTMSSLTWVLGSICAGIAGILISPLVFLFPSMGLIGMKAFPAAILGGMDSIIGAIIGGLIIGLSESTAGVYLPEEIKNIFPWLILILVLIIRPEGIFRKKYIKKV